ncbi:MAG: DEAD/DEAH box helicase [Lachnospiraceae bacterium]
MCGKEQTSELENPFPVEADPLDDIISRLGYQLTGAQRAQCGRSRQDMSGKSAMNRLIQGDVGSGKTIIAFLAMILAAGNHLQSALMVPTEVLANQHYEALTRLTIQQGLPIQAVLLTGSMTAKQKREVYERSRRMRRMW